MAFTRPTLAELAERIEQDLVSRLPLTGGVLRRSMVKVLGKVMAGAAHMLHGHLDFLSEQILADRAEGEYLVRLASMFGIERLEPTYAQGELELTGTNGTVIPIGTVFVRSDGALYTSDAEVTIAGGVAAVDVTAETADENSNTDAGVVLEFQSPIAGADADATVGTDGLVGGADEEEIEALRVRLIDRMRSPPHGGNEADYEAWSLELAGVTRAWVYPRELGAGSVVVRFMRDNDSGSPIPSGGEVAALQAHLDEVRPVTARVVVMAPVADALNMTIHIVPDTTANRAAVQAELLAKLREEIPGETTLISQLELAVGGADGIEDFTITVPAGNVAHATGHLAQLGLITWV